MKTKKISFFEQKFAIPTIVIFLSWHILEVYGDVLRGE